MFNCFPILYEDELFYSIASRYKRMCGMSSKKALFQDFCNVQEKQILMYLPVHINALINNLPFSSKITAEYLINKHTLFPYLTAFVSTERAKDVYTKMLEGARESPLVKVGVNSSRVKFDGNLKYCRYCCKEDIENSGESYWRRLFQIPGVLYCLKHKVRLIQSNIPADANTTEYINADEILSDNICEDSKILNEKLFDLNIKYIKDVQYLLQNELCRKDNKFIFEFYIDKLRQKGLASQGGVIYMGDFLREFKHYYTCEYLTLMQSNFDNDNKNNWLRLFVRKENKSRSVLRHLLLLNFVDVSVEEFFNERTTQGRVIIIRKSEQRLDLDEKKEQWIKIINDNPNTSRRELGNIGKGIYSYVYRHDRGWYNKVTPVYKQRKSIEDVINWEERDKECIEILKKAVEDILNRPGKPIRITKNYLKRGCKLPSYFKSDKLTKTKEYLTSVLEDIYSYRKRKILWAIKEMKVKGIELSVYKVHQYAGFGEVKHESIKSMIEDLINIA
ncbi:hypothetical protein HMPREF1982_00371 [Clostridiales bacterium oral taxon 876 str. F0540]|nr:hypothetical protein HMPREF1982_00371 [Clostridiales bacterium oral taxon 876 str. F0540]